MKCVDELLSFIEKSPCSYQAVRNMELELSDAGFVELRELDAWELKRGGKYFVTRNQSALIAFRIPQGEYRGYQIMASHSDSPSFKVKENPEMREEGRYVKLNVEKYGGLLCAPWFDRPLSVAGRIMVKTDQGLESRLIMVDRDLLLIPNLAIHMNREVNDGYKYNIQKDLLPLWSSGETKEGFLDLIAREARVEKEQIMGSDLLLYNRERGCVWGADESFVSAPRLDDIECAYASLKGILSGGSNFNVTVHCVLDNEEVGSETRQGAASTFLLDVLRRINDKMGRKEEDFTRSIAASFMLSADNAHGVHPNYREKADPTNRPYLNGGIVIKHSANQKYTTDAVSDAVFRSLCESAGVKYQHFHNRSDILGGSTLGNIATAHVPVNTVDIGLPQLAMHSPYETAGVEDYQALLRLSETFFNASICQEGNCFRISE